MLYFNATLFGKKAMGFLAELDPDNKPDAIAFMEVHLRGTDLNVARRKVKQMGWRMLGTPAITKAELRAAAGEQPRDGPPEQVEHEDNEEASSAKYHNSGGEAILVNPCRVATGYHQPKEAFGYRSVLLRMKGWTLHLIACYFDCGWPLEAGPYAEKWKQIQGLVTAINLPWVIVGDFNRDLPTKAQLAALEELIKYLRKRVGRSKGRVLIVKAHREINPKPTDCPGNRFPYNWMHRTF